MVPGNELTTTLDKINTTLANLATHISKAAAVPSTVEPVHSQDHHLGVCSDDIEEVEAAEKDASAPAEEVEAAEKDAGAPATETLAAGRESARSRAASSSSRRDNSG